MPRPAFPLHHHRARCLALLAAAGLTGLTLVAAPGAAPLRAGAAARSGGAFDVPPTAAQCLALDGGRCLTPQQLRSAYDLTGLYGAGDNGAGVSIGIVDSFGSPTIRNDLAVYDAAYGLPPVDLQILTPAGPPPPFAPRNDDMAGWASETTLDLEVAHTVAPGAKLVLIETPTSETEGIAGFPDIITAENYVISHHLVDVLSQSFAATEPTFASPAQLQALSAQVYPAARAAGVTVLSASGDSGPTDVGLDSRTLYPTPQVDWPASDPLVTAVGGTMLDIGADGQRQSPDAAWGGAEASGAGGGGLSHVFGRPPFQDGVAATVGAHRGVPDISLDAAPSSGLIIYGSFRGRDWEVGGGTSQAAPLMAGIVALADQRAHGRVGYLNDLLYGPLAHTAGAGIVDVSRGSNANPARSNTVPGYVATRGYDLATGLGTIDAGAFVPALATAAGGRTRPLSGSAVPSSPPPVPVPSRATAQAGSRPPVAAAAHRSRSGNGKAVAEIVALALLLAVAGGLAAAGASRRRPPS